MPGQGDLPVTAFMEAVRATGYDGVLSLEIFNDQFRSGSANSVAIDGKRSLVFLDDQVSRASRELPEHEALPPRSPCSGIEFIEFAVDDQAATLLGTLIRSLGFRQSGTHKTKDVTLWSQNGVNLLINSDREGFARSSYNVHGPSVCALCLRVDDAHAVVERAKALVATPFHQSVLDGQLEIPAIRGVGGSLIYFIDDRSDLARLWNIDFETCGQASPEDHVGLTGIDHVAQSMEYDEMLSWLLFYTSLLDVTKTPSLDIPDPGGLVRSLVVQTADRSLSLVLNGSQSQHTASARFLSEFFGSGVQHIAFTTNDIVQTARAIKASGLETLPIPDNYYDDLEARFDLADDGLAELKELGILYDRDGDGEFFQIFTRTFDSRFFFEIVERRGYKGFGASNAAIRLAVQQRLSRHPAIPRH